MSKRSRYRKPSEETEAAAVAIARGTQRPGQTKEQTKLIAQGIQKGIDQYKRQQRAKAREVDRRLKRTAETRGAAVADDVRVETKIEYRQSSLPWVLLIISWVGFLLLLGFLYFRHYFPAVGS